MHTLTVGSRAVEFSLNIDNQGFVIIPELAERVGQKNDFP
jgi:hypothetical protein